MNRHRLETKVGGRILSLGVAVSLLVGACSSSPTPAPTSSPTQAATAAATSAAPAATSAATSAATPAASTAASGGKLVVGITSDIDTLDPWKATQFQAVAILGNIYGTLTELDQNLNVVPGLAASWQASSDGKTITLALRQGAKFHDGSPVTSADVKYSLDTIVAPATAAVAAASLASVASVATPDANTVVLSMKSPDAALMAALASVNLAIKPAQAAAASLATQPDGTGPFKFDSRKPNESLTLAANAGYWGTAPLLASIEFRVVPDEPSIVAAMQSGNINFADLADPLVAKSAADAGLTVAKTPQLAYHALQLNAARKPLDNLKVRLAIQCAIDRQQVLDTAASGEGKVVGPITSPAYASDPSARPCPTRDVAKAKQYLSDAGYPNGITIKSIVSQGEYATSVNEAQNIQAQLKDAGITLTLDVMQIDPYVTKWLAADFDTAIALNGGRPDPDTMYGRYFTSTGNLNKVAGFHSPELDTLFAQGKSTLDPAARKPIYTQISNYLEDNAVWIWLFSSYSYTVTTSNVSGFIPMANASLQYLRVTSIK